MRIAHKVKQDETVGTIAEQYGVPWRDVLKWNNIEADTLIGKDTPFTVLEINVPDTSPAMEEVNVPVTTPTDEYEGVAPDSDAAMAQVKDFVSYDALLAEAPEWGFMEAGKVQPSPEEISALEAAAPPGEPDPLKSRFVPDPGTETGTMVSDIQPLKKGLSIREKGLIAYPEKGKTLEPGVQPSRSEQFKLELREKKKLDMTPAQLAEVEKQEDVDLGYATAAEPEEEVPTEEVADIALTKAADGPVTGTQAALLKQDIINTVEAGITNEKAKGVFKDIIADQEAMVEEYGLVEFWFEEEEERYRRLADDLETEITGYEEKILAVGEETMPPVFEGTNKFWAVIAAALGAGAASMTGTPNFALQIINKTIDTELEKFLKSREIRKDTAERQQLNLITKRGELLADAKLAAKNAMAALKGRSGAMDSIATVTRIEEMLAQQEDMNEKDFMIKVANVFLNEAKINQTAIIEYGKKYVPGLTVRDTQGKLVKYTPARGRTDKDVQDMKDYTLIVKNTMDELDKLDKLLYLTPQDKAEGNINPAIYLPSGLSDTRTKLNAIAGALEIDYKKLYKMGANYSIKEQMLVAGQIPKIESEGWDSWLGRIGVKAITFRKRILDRYKNNYETLTQGGSHNYGETGTLDQRRKGNEGPIGPPPGGKTTLVKGG
jgi:hypothetical protein